MRLPLLFSSALIASTLAAPAVAVPSADVQAGKCSIPQLIAHRGGGGQGTDPYYYENSWKAFYRSKDLGVKVIETDVHWTIDNVAVIMHDDLLDRTTNGTGKVSDKTIAYVESLELNNGGGKVPLFEDVLKWAKENNLQLWPEYKADKPNQAWVEDYAAKIKAVGTDVVVPSFLKPELEQFKTLLPGIPQIWFQQATDFRAVVPADVPAGAYAGIIDMNSSKASYAALAKAGITTYTWYNIITGGDDPLGWAEAARMKPAGIITDYPEKYQKWAATTDYCKTPKVKCAAPPKKLRADSTVVLLRKTCKTTAGSKVKVKATGKGKIVKGKRGKVSLVTKARGAVTLTYKAAGTNKAGPYKLTKKYRLK